MAEATWRNGYQPFQRGHVDKFIRGGLSADKEVLAQRVKRNYDLLAGAGSKIEEPTIYTRRFPLGAPL